MALTVRLPKETEERLKMIADREKKTKTEIIKDSLELYFNQYRSDKTAFELGKDLFGKYESGHGDLSINSEVILRQKMKDKRGGTKPD